MFRIDLLASDVASLEFRSEGPGALNAVTAVLTILCAENCNDKDKS